jgi:hypothetical protein
MVDGSHYSPFVLMPYDCNFGESGRKVLVVLKSLIATFQICQRLNTVGAFTTC